MTRQFELNFLKL